jgi:hypothetical protein
MSDNEVLDEWLIHKRAVSPPRGLANGVMSQIGEASRGRRSVVTPIPRRRSMMSRCAPVLIASAVGVVCVVRVASLFRVLIEPTPEYSVVVGEPLLKEPKDERDVSRS